jgi:hypothetical protein
MCYEKYIIGFVMEKSGWFNFLWQTSHVLLVNLIDNQNQTPKDWS